MICSPYPLALIERGQNYFFQFLLGIISHMPVNKSAFFEDEERWGIRDSILLLRSGIPVDAKLAEYDLALEIRSHFIYSWVD
jgi:hypothetical protein